MAVSLFGQPSSPFSRIVAGFGGAIVGAFLFGPAGSSSAGQAWLGIGIGGFVGAIIGYWLGQWLIGRVVLWASVFYAAGLCVASASSNHDDAYAYGFWALVPAGIGAFLGFTGWRGVLILNACLVFGVFGDIFGGNLGALIGLGLGAGLATWAAYAPPARCRTAVEYQWSGEKRSAMRFSIADIGMLTAACAALALVASRHFDPSVTVPTVWIGMGISLFWVIYRHRA